MTRLTSLPLSEAVKLKEDRGPRYAVSAGDGRFQRVLYADTAEEAERLREWLLTEMRDWPVRVHPPQGSTDLAPYANRREKAMEAAEEATAILRAAVIRAAEQGRSESEIARSARVSRQTVRQWLGK